MDKATLVTGASSGIGRELARLFARDGHHLVLVARNRQKLEELARELETQHGVETKVIVKDLADPASPEEIVDQLRGEGIQVENLINNAGTQVYGLFAETELDRQLAMIQVNMTSLTHLTGLLLPGMVERGRGRILNLGSIGSFAPGPLNAVYCAAKAYVLSFSEATAAELSGTGVTVTALCPGATDTAFAPRHGLEDVRLFRNMMSADRVARIGYRALMKGRHVVVTGLGNQLQVLGFKLLMPFVPLIPPKMIMRIGTFLMG
jgi:short-subunit dehydrogenase